MKLWLDDVRHPWAHGCLGWTWAKTAEEAIAALVTGQVTQASLDHDLHWEHYPGSGTPPSAYKHLTGMAVVEWMRDHNVWPRDGVAVHSQNPEKGRAMKKLIHECRHYAT
jgi:hypothetical protein